MHHTLLAHFLGFFDFSYWKIHFLSNYKHRKAPVVKNTGETTNNKEWHNLLARFNSMWSNTLYLDECYGSEYLPLHQSIKRRLSSGHGPVPDCFASICLMLNNNSCRAAGGVPAAAVVPNPGPGRQACPGTRPSLRSSRRCHRWPLMILAKYATWYSRIKAITLLRYNLY